ncbi:MAG: SH3 domain-containing protein, partial [Chloroflexota bacterium]
SQTITCAGAPQSRLVVGEQAQIIADGGSNLRVRPSTDAILLDIIPANAIIPVIDGPFCGGGYAWWQVDYAGERGWVAEGLDEFYWLAPYIIQRAQIDTVRIEIQPILVNDILIERLPDPARSQFVLEGYPIESSQIVPFVVIFDEMPANLETDERTIVQRETVSEGIRTVEIRIADPTQTDTDVSLVYHYTRTLADGRFVDAYLPIIAPNLPLAYDLPEDETDTENYLVDYLEMTTVVINSLSDDDFTPSLTNLDNLIRSLRYDSPSEMSDLLRYQHSEIAFDYHPVLATEIIERDTATDTSPNHVALQFRDYPAGDGFVRIYASEVVPSNVILTLQQVIQRQPSNPPQIPLLTEQGTPTSRENIIYLSFVNGDGIRYLATIDDEQFYTYQGLSADGQTIISALFMVTEDTRLNLLDNLINSLEITQ